MNSTFKQIAVSAFLSALVWTGTAVQVMGASEPAAVEVLQNRFLATGTVQDIKAVQRGPQRFALRIEKTESVKGFANSGAAYQGKDVTVLSETGIPAAVKIGSRITVMLRVTGDEWKQTLFLVEVMDNGSRK